MLEIRNVIVAVGMSQVNASEVERDVYALEWVKFVAYDCFMSEVITEF